MVFSTYLAVGVRAAGRLRPLAETGQQRISVEHLECRALDGTRHFEPAVRCGGTLLVDNKIVAVCLDLRPVLIASGIVSDPAPALPVLHRDAIVYDACERWQLVIHA